MNRGLSWAKRPLHQFPGDKIFAARFEAREAALRSQSTQPWITALLALALAGSVVGYQVISFLPEPLGVDSRAITVPFRAALSGLYLAVLLLGFCSRRRIGLSLPVVALGVFLVLYTTRLLLDTVIAPVPLELPPGDYIAYFLGMSLLPVMAFLLGARSCLDRWTLGLIVVMSAATCAVSVVYNLSDPVGNGRRMFGNECLNPITLGHTGVSLFLLVLWHWLQRANRLTTWFLAVGYGALALLGLYVVFRAASRGSMVALVVLLPLLLCFGWRKRARVWVAVVVGSALAAVPFVIEWTLAAGTDLSLYLGSLDAVLGGESALNRYTLIRDAWAQFLENPIWGSSLVERNSLFYPHNYLVESFMATGVMGGVAFCVVVLYSVWKSLHLFWRHPTNGWTALLYLQALVGGMFSGALYYAPAFWALLGIVLASGFPRNSFSRDQADNAAEREAQSAPFEESRAFPAEPAEGSATSPSLPHA